MRPFRAFLLLVGLLLLAAAIALPFKDVRTKDGHFCGSAWHAARKEIVGTTGFTATKIDIETACKLPGRKVLKESTALAGGGAVLLVIVAAWPAKKWRNPEVPVQYV